MLHVWYSYESIHNWKVIVSSNKEKYSASKVFFYHCIYLITDCVPQQGEYKRSLKCKKHNNNRTQRPSIKIILCYSKEEHTQRTHCKQTVYIKTTSWRQHLYTFFTADLFINAWTYFFEGKKRWRKGSPSRLKIAIIIIKRNKLKTLNIQNFFRWHNRDIYECTGAFY